MEILPQAQLCWLNLLYILFLLFWTILSREHWSFVCFFGLWWIFFWVKILRQSWAFLLLCKIWNVWKELRIFFCFWCNGWDLRHSFGIYQFGANLISLYVKFLDFGIFRLFGLHLSFFFGFVGSWNFEQGFWRSIRLRILKRRRRFNIQVIYYFFRFLNFLFNNMNFIHLSSVLSRCLVSVVLASLRGPGSELLRLR